MPQQKKPKVIRFEEDEEVLGCPYDYSEELEEQLRAVSKNKMKKVK
jgi:hypothetical protein